VVKITSYCEFLKGRGEVVEGLVEGVAKNEFGKRLGEVVNLVIEE
jgi:hypothetical protein